MSGEQISVSRSSDGPLAKVAPNEITPAESSKRMSRSEIIGWILLVGSLIFGFGLTIFAPN